MRELPHRLDRSGRGGALGRILSPKVWRTYIAVLAFSFPFLGA